MDKQYKVVGNNEAFTPGFDGGESAREPRSRGFSLPWLEPYQTYGVAVARSSDRSNCVASGGTNHDEG
jgi:hypothetical protein